MPIKEKNFTNPSETNSAGVGLPGDRLRFNADIDARLTKFMEDNPRITEYYTKLVKENPERAIRTFALKSMFKQEDLARQVERQMPQVKQWVNQHPGLEQQIEAKIRTTNPIMRMAVYIKEAFKAKASVDFAPPANKMGTGVSI